MNIAPYLTRDLIALTACTLVLGEANGYYYIGGGIPELRNTGAASVLEPIKRSVPSFGAVQTPYFQLTDQFPHRARGQKDAGLVESLITTAAAE